MPASRLLLHPALCAVNMLLLSTMGLSQLHLNEASNRNFSTVVDEDGEAKDWVELYNSSNEAIDLEGYSLSDDPGEPGLFTFPPYTLGPGEYLLVFCSGKNRFYSEGFQQVGFYPNYSPQSGWNTHVFQNPFEWDGISDLVVNVCSYRDQGYTENAIFNQSETGYVSSIARFNDGSDASCQENAGDSHTRRPNIRLNNQSIGNGTLTNGTTDYPAPYGNWYWSARNQSLYRAEDLLAAGLSAGPINSLAWDVVSTNSITYTYIDISIKQMNLESMSSEFIGNEGAYFHTNFGISSQGENVGLYDPQGNLVNSLFVNAPGVDLSVGSLSDGSSESGNLYPPSPGSSNNGSGGLQDPLPPPFITLESGVYDGVQSLEIAMAPDFGASVYYTTNGDLPNENSMLYSGETIPVYLSGSIRARAYAEGYIPSEVVSKTYLINVNHSTPILSLITDPSNLYGDEGIFTNWQFDWERFAQVSYFDSTEGHPLLFSRDLAMQIDGGAGGSRSHPQHSFRLEFDKGAFQGVPLDLAVLPNRPQRSQYSRLYFRNGSNMWLTLPYKDAALVEMMAAQSKGYFSAMRPVSVYINGGYFGLYEMREKTDWEFFEIYDQSTVDDPDVLSVSYWYGGQLRATAGDPNHYWQSLDALWALEPSSPDYLEEADALFDMEYLADYIIGQSWIGNADWPYNNIKISRNDATAYRWRFTTIDLELSLAPNGWTDCYWNGLEHVFNQGEFHPFTGPWTRSLQHEAYRNYSINRFADLLNSSYRVDRLLAIENTHFERWVVEMPNEYQRWGNPWDVPGQMNEFIARHEALQNDLICKSEVIRDQVQEQFDLSGQVSLTLDVIPAGAGKIHINTIEPDGYPWDGIYFHGVPVSLTADANEGYAFVAWEPNGVVSDFADSTWVGELNFSSVGFTALFESTVDVADLEEATTSLALFPNPAGQAVNLQHPSKRISEWRLWDMGGRCIDGEVLSVSASFWRISTAHLPPGTYVLDLRYLDGTSERERLVVVR